MPCHYTLQKSSDLISIELEGNLSEEEIAPFIGKLSQDSSLKLIGKQMVLLKNIQGSISLVRLIELIESPPCEVDRKTALIIEQEEDYRRAFTDERSWQILPPSIKLFSVKEEGAQWLAKV